MNDVDERLDRSRRNASAALLLVSALLGALPATPSFAQGPAEVLLVVGWAEPIDAQREASRIGAMAEEALRAQGERVVDTSHVGVASTPAALPEGLDDEIHACVDDAIRAFAAGEVGRGNEIIARCRTLIASARDPLLRDDRNAAQVLDSCLVMVRAILAEQGRGHDAARAEASAQARVCRAEVPETAPTVRRHTREVMDVLAEVDERIRREGGVLIVRHEDGQTCDVRINGRAIGRTPATARLASGTYRVRAECPNAQIQTDRVQMEAGRETEVLLQSPNDVLRAFPDLRRTDAGHVALVYPEHDMERFVADARRLARALGTEQYAGAWVEPSDDGWRYHLTRGDAHGSGTTSVPQREGDDALRRRLEVLFTRSGATPPTTVSESDSAPRFDPTPHLVGSVALATVGAALLTSALVLSSLCDEQSPDGHCLARNPDYALIGPLGIPGVAMALGGTGWLLGTLAEDATAWFIAGATASAGAVGAAIYLGASIATRGCRDRTATGGCRAQVNFSDEAAATWTAATLTLALGAATYFVLGATDEGRGPRLRVGVSPSSIHLGGVF